MKLKLPDWEIGLFVCINLLSVLGVLPYAYFTMYFANKISRQQTSSDTAILLSVFMTIGILFILYFFIRLFVFYIGLNIIANKGQNFYRQILAKVRKRCDIKLFVILVLVILDIICARIGYAISTNNLPFHYIPTLKDYKDYFAFSGLSLAYLSAFILWGIEDWAKNLKVPRP